MAQVRSRTQGVDVDAALTSHLGSLDLLATLPLPSNQLSRLAQFRRTQDRWDFLAARALCLSLVARTTGLRPTDIELYQLCRSCGSTAHGQPYIRSNFHALPSVHISWAHSHGSVAAACGIGVSVGVDIERIDQPLPTNEFLCDAFTDVEWRLINATSDPGRSFRRIWTQKEAIVKLGKHTLDQVLATPLAHLLTEHPNISVTSWEDRQAGGHIGLATERKSSLQVDPIQ